MNNPCWLLITCLLVHLGSAPLRSQTPARFPGGPLPDGLSPELAGLLQDMLAVYRNATSYRDDGRVTILQESGRIRHITKMPSSLQLRRPDRLQVISGMQTISCDGSQLQIVLDAVGQYRQTPAPSHLTSGDVRLGAPGAALEEGFPEVLEFLLGDSVFERWMAAILRLEHPAPDHPVSIDGRPCHAIVYETRHHAKITLYIDTQTLLLQRCDMDYTRAQRPAGGSRGTPDQDLPSLQYAYQLHPVQINIAIPDTAFALRRLPDMRRVAEFVPPDPTSPDFETDGHAAEITPSLSGDAGIRRHLPGFRAEALDGAPVDREKLAGKVVLLFFWTPRGSAESLASIQMVQRLAGEFPEPQGFHPIGITPDIEDKSFLRDLLKAKQATFPTILDRNGALMREFEVSVMPTFCLVSTSGEITAVFAGLPREGEETLRTLIRELLNPPAGSSGESEELSSPIDN